MIKYLILLSFAVFFLFDDAIAAPLLPEQAKQYIKITYPNYTINGDDYSSYHIVDLDGDEIPEIAIILTYYTSEEYHIRVLILKGMIDGTFKTLTITKPLLMPPHGVEFNDRRKSLYIYSYYRIDSTVHREYSYQFKFRNSQFVLIGLEYSDEAQVETEPSYRDISISVNYLTGDMINTYRKKGKVTKQVRSKIPSAPLIQFKDFDDLMFVQDE